MKRTLWETYFDTSISRKMGRRVRKEFKTDQLFQIMNSMNLSYTVSEAKYPKSPAKAVRKIEIEWDGSKEKLIKEIESNVASVS